MGLYIYTIDSKCNILVDLVRFELTISSSHLRNINHLRTVWRKTKDLARGDVDSGGFQCAVA